MGEGRARGGEGGQWRVTIDLLGRHDVLGEDEVGLPVGDQRVLVAVAGVPAALALADEAGIGVHGVGDAVCDLPAVVGSGFV